MKIAIFVKNISTIGGLEVVTIKYALQLIANGDNVHILSADFTNVPLELQGTSVEIYHIKKNAKNLVLNEKQINDALAYFKEKNIAHAVFMVGSPDKRANPMSDLRLILGISKICKTDLYFHSSPASYFRRNWNSSYAFIGNVLRKIKTIFYSEYKAKNFFQVLNKSSVQIFTLCKGCYSELNKYCGVDSTVKYSLYVLEKRNMQSKKNFVTACGRLAPENNFFLLLKAWKLIDTKGWTLRIIGDGNQEIALRKFCKKNNLKNIEFVGFVPHSRIYDFMEESKIFCFMGCYGTNPTVLCEAMNMGNAIITTRYLGISDELLNDENSIITGYKTREYAFALSKLLSNERLVDRMGIAAYNKCKEFYSSKEYLENTFIENLTEIQDDRNELISCNGVGGGINV